ncbi:hypothetical protein G9U51_02260 [Calidifontibacter sp. DB0510]|uniref:Uncharacterized protein n=1 Tax=Metallococcus carri TaxID=1656884 RepID=A0A967EG41_9MICO|nr:hypothetical protein [Metallococcus carri]NHN54603.1 hypothetical protein [Metallococcus carri]NOP36558.1 hypothetical protein [Calidifontibacter sp. DB2511S]
MTDQPTYELVRGEMRPWTDYEGENFPAGGPVLTSVLADLASSVTGRVLVAGPTSADTVRAVAGEGRSVDLLVRGADDAERLGAELTGVRVIAGALDGLVADNPQPYDLVIAVAGVDRLTSYDAQRVSFADQLQMLAGLTTDGGVLAVAHEFDTAPASVLDARPEDQRHGDNDWRPVDTDTTRPVDHAGFVAAVRAVRAGEVDDLLLFGPPAAPRAAVNSRVTREAENLTDLLVAAAGATHRPLLAAPDEQVTRLVRVGRVADAADAALLIVGGRVAGDVITAAGDRALTATLAATGEPGWTSIRTSEPVAWPDARFAPGGSRDTAQPSETGRYVPAPAASEPSPLVTVEPSLAPSRVALSPTLHQLLRYAAATDDVPEFRRLAAEFGGLVETVPVTERRVLTTTTTVLDGGSVRPGLDIRAWTTTVSVDEALAAAFWLLQDAFVRARVRLPWPHHVRDAALTATWVEMAGGTADDASLARGRELADALSQAAPVVTTDLRAALADADAARRELGEAQGHIAGLERTIGFRDKQLRTREDVIRNLRKSPGAGLAASKSTGTSVAKLVKRTSEVRSFGELTAGVNRVVKRRQRQKQMRSKA